jgi:hypothetical protein
VIDPNTIHEGLEERPLFCNPILTNLAIFVAKGAFRDSETIEQLLALKPSNEEETFLLRREPHMLDLPIYQRKDGKFESASTFSTRLRDLARRAGYACPHTMHDFRAEALVLIVSLLPCLYSIPSLMQSKRSFLFPLSANETSRASGRSHLYRILRSNESGNGWPG